MMSAIQPMQTESILNEWIVNDQQIHLLEEGKKLKFEVINDQGDKTVYGCSTPAQVTIDKVISYLLTCNVLLQEDGPPIFLKPHHQWTVGEKVISLFAQTNALICQVFDKNIKKSIQQDLFECIIPSHRCHEETIRAIEEVETKTLSEQIQFFKHFEIYKFIDEEGVDQEIANWGVTQKYKERLYQRNIAETGLVAFASLVTLPVFPVLSIALSAGRTVIQLALMYRDKQLTDKQNTLAKKIIEIKAELKNRNCILEIEPLSAPSQLDKRTLVSHFTWAVTLITYNGLSKNHAQICFEGLKNGIYFCQLGHFTGDDVNIKDQNKIKFTTRSEIWMRKSQEVQKVIDLIKQEEEDIKKGKLVISYSKFGKRSFIKINDEFAGGKPNCLDWAREKLALIDIELEENPTKKAIKEKAEYIVAVPEFYTRKRGYYLDKPINIAI
jgi:hypothetical protein